MRSTIKICVLGVLTASALISAPAFALKQQDKSVKDFVLDATTLTQSKADAMVGDTEVRTVILGDARIETAKNDKPRKFVCLIGEKGKVLLTFFSSPQS